MGTKIVVLKLGNRGLYFRTRHKSWKIGDSPSNLSNHLGRITKIGPPCFQVDVVGTTGSGDATIAGFFAALLRISPVKR